MSASEQPVETADHVPNQQNEQNEQNDDPTDPMFRISIKNPIDRPGSAPFTLSVAPATTIRALKQTLSNDYPGKPAVSAQRLIHGGKLLTDASTLASILRPDTTATHTLHLVVSTTGNPPTSRSNPPLQYPPNPAPFPPNHNLPPNYNPYFAPLHMHPPPYPFPHPPPPSDAPPHPPNLAADPNPQDHDLAERILAYIDQARLETPNEQFRRNLLAIRLRLDTALAALHGLPPPYPFIPPNQTPVHQRDPIPDQPPNPNPNPQPNQPQQNPLPANAMGFDFRVHRQNAPRIRHFVFHFELNWSLIAKLALVVYFLTQEGHTTRVYFLVITAVTVYLWRLGHLRFLRTIFSTALPSPSRFVNMLFPARAPRFAMARVALTFAYSFVYGFFFSLLPAWNPERMPDVIRLAEPEENNPTDQATRGETQAAGDQQPHDHAD